MMVAKVVHIILIRICLLVLLLVSSLTQAIESDINCLPTIESQLKKSNPHLPGTGRVTQWTDGRILSIDLSGFDLQGKFPSGVKECSSLTSLDLSRNNLSGTIPSDVFLFLPYLVTLDLSYNSFSGEIPPSLSNIVYLNNLLLDHNYLTGHIPSGLVLIQRLKQFSVAYNHLKGPIPQFNNGNISRASFESNLDLCGFPLDPCVDPFFTVSIIAVVIAAVIFFPIGAAMGWFCVHVGEENKQRPRRR